MRRAGCGSCGRLGEAHGEATAARDGRRTVPGTRRMMALSRAALPAALLWAVGAAAWNIEGVRRIAAGDQPLGPTASLAGAAIIGLLALALLWGQGRSRLLFGAAAAVILIASGLAVWGAFTGTPEMWPSAAWRWGGAALNALGVVSAGLLLARAVRPPA